MDANVQALERIGSMLKLLHASGLERDLYHAMMQESAIRYDAHAPAAGERLKVAQDRVKSLRDDIEYFKKSGIA